MKCEHCGAPLGSVPDENIGEPEPIAPSEGPHKDWSSFLYRVVVCEKCRQGNAIPWEASSS